MIYSLSIRYKSLLPTYDLVCCGTIYGSSRGTKEIRELVKATPFS
jgi:hypothetical protein